ncbi:rRNA pseudouridine synthase [Candidatus Kaiserbacteria bacterium]|nr:rRNA pseudouridine synthase [Candidatus Kaiserbacteria bacterium]
MDLDFPVRINKYLAHKGYATRRDADTLIEKGLVLVNGVPAIIGQKVDKKDVIEVRGMEKKAFRYLLYYKPRGVITHSPAPHETDIAMELRKTYKLTGIFPVGRLDKDSEGLMILTDDGRVTDRLLNPAHEHEREYEVTVDKAVTGALIKRLAGGVTIERYRTKPAIAKRLGERRLSLTLTEGKKHQVRRMCAALGYQVTALKRVRIGTLSLGALKPNQYKLLKGTEQKKFLSWLTLPVG